MISKVVDTGAVSVTAQEADDVLNLRRLIRPGDVITGETWRTIKREREYSRPDSGQRVRVKVSLEVKKVSLEDAVDVLRISGTILKSSNEEIQHGAHHAMRIKISTSFVIRKKSWSRIERRLVRPTADTQGAVLVAIDRSDCGIGRLAGTHLDMIPDIYSGAGGKRYRTEFKAERFFGSISRAVQSVCKKGDIIVLFGPGQTKNRLANYMKTGPGVGFKVEMAEGIDSGGQDGIYTFIRSDEMARIMSGSKLAKIGGIINGIMAMAASRGRRFAMGFEETDRANQYGAIESIVFSDRALHGRGDEALIKLLNDAESGGASVFSVDGSTDLGLRVSGMGGIIAMLRFAVDV